MGVDPHRLQAKRVLARRNHRESDGMTVSTCVHMFGFQPRAQPRIIDFRLPLPEIGSQTALDPEMIEL